MDDGQKIRGGHQNTARNPVLSPLLAQAPRTALPRLTSEFIKHIYEEAFAAGGHPLRQANVGPRNSEDVFPGCTKKKPRRVKPVGVDGGLDALAVGFGGERWMSLQPGRNRLLPLGPAIDWIESPATPVMTTGNCRLPGIDTRSKPPRHAARWRFSITAGPSIMLITLEESDMKGCFWATSGKCPMPRRKGPQRPQPHTLAR